VTKIKFDIPSEGKSQKAKVKLVIYDILGKEIRTLVNEQLQPGTYEVTFDGSNLPSGVYFYQLRAGEFVETKKLVLLK
jgi:flagellar hook assembly protein FlgD